MDMYMRNVKVIEDAFNTIKEQTGISSNEEIVLTFCKSEEQNNSLVHYINNLNTDIDVIDDQNKVITSEIRTCEFRGSVSAAMKHTFKKKLTQEVNEIKNETKIKEA